MCIDQKPVFCTGLIQVWVSSEEIYNHVHESKGALKSKSGRGLTNQFSARLLIGLLQVNKHKVIQASCELGIKYHENQHN